MGTPNEQVKVKCGECGFEFMSGAKPENRRCKNQDPVCNSANISVVDDSTADGVECTRCGELEEKIVELEKANGKLQDDLEAAKKAVPKAAAAGDIIFTMEATDPYWKGRTLVITKKTDNAIAILEKYIQRADGSQSGAEYAAAARKALVKLPKKK